MFWNSFTLAHDTPAPHRLLHQIEQVYDSRATLRRWPAACSQDDPGDPSASAPRTPASAPTALARPTSIRATVPLERDMPRPVAVERAGTAGCAIRRTHPVPGRA